ncbi:MORC family CW-type zinc finger protein [Striga asiatica]|uniref:MORC family CW-type zinc finger protein n=1 Tax=Striga asiatica TaxID=4170 RepID=A0A5A7Q5J3_STRAF|nr:MORC family CW-type zinc finger protein [Striga asiatica]
MEDCESRKELLKEGFSQSLVKLTKDKKIISRVACVSAPSQMPAVWDVPTFVRKEKIDCLSMLPGFSLYPACEDHYQEKEWGLFLDYLRKHDRVGISKLGSCEIFILTTGDDPKSRIATVLYKGQIPITSLSKKCHALDVADSDTSPPELLAGEGVLSDSDLIEDKISPHQRHLEVNGGYYRDLKSKGGDRVGNSAGSSRSLENYVVAHPSYLRTLGQAHSGWIFGAIAELVDNSRDAKATKLEVAIGTVYAKNVGKDIPMLSLIDDGHGMSHDDVRRMISFGHAQPEADDPQRIGRYGVGFKTGAMRLGKDALVLTQTANSRSIAFLSQSLNQGKENLEIPIVSYRRIGQFMEVDKNVQNEDSAKYNLKVIKKFSPFDKYLIGEKVPLDFSLKSYLEVIFLDPRMKIYVQGALVKSRPLAKSLNQTVVQTGIVLGKQLKLTIGRSQLEWEQANCGIFLYWHGRLIEDDSNGHVWVHSNKQGFQDCEAYAELEKWLGEKVDEYLDKYVDKIEVRKTNSLCKPDHDWVQCDKCRKWRVLGGDFDIKKLPLEWFCYMKPFNGRCDMPEEDVSGLITISTKRHGQNTNDSTDSRERPENATSGIQGDVDDTSSESSDEEGQLTFKRQRTLLPRNCCLMCCVHVPLSGLAKFLCKC